MGTSQFNIYGQVTLDTGPAAAGVKQVGSEIQNLAQTGIAGFEQVRSRLIAATREVVNLRKELQAATDPQDVARLNAALGKAQQQMTLARTELRGMSMAQMQASETASLLAAQFGVHIPAGMERLIARAPAVQAALSSAFSAVAVGALIGAIEMAIFKTEWFAHLLGGMTEQEAAAAKKSTAEQAELSNRVQKAQDDLNATRATGIAKIEAERIAQVHALEAEMAAHNALERSFYEHLIWIANLTAAEKKRQELVKEGEDAAKKAQEAEKQRAEAFKSLNAILMTAAADRAGIEGSAEEKIRLDAQKTFAQIADLERKYPQLHAAAEAARLAVTEDISAKIVDLHKKEVQAVADSANSAAKTFGEKYNQVRVRAVGESLHGIAKIEFERQQEILEIQKDAETAREKILDGRLLTVEEVAAAEKDIAAKTAEEIAIINASAQKRAVDQMAGQIENFIDRVFLTAKSLSDVFHQFLMQLLGSFVKWVSREIALAWSGMKQMTGGQAAGGGGGIFGSLLGSMFGLDSAGVSPAQGYAAGTAALPGDIGIEGITGGLTSGAIVPYGAGAGGIPGTAGGASSGVFGRLAFGKASLEELMASGLPSAGMILGGGALLGSAFGAGGPVKGAIGGGLVGLGIAGLLGVGLFGGPIGLAIAGIAAGIGALIGAWGRGRAKEKATGIEQGVEFAANDLYAQFKNFETDYQSALAGMQVLIQQGQQAELASGTGKWGQKGAENLTRVIQDEITALNNLQRQRETSANVLGGMSIPEFAVGGQVLGVGSGVLAILHPGEFVMQRSAVDALGANFLAALNRAPRFDSGGSVGPALASPTALHIGTINVYPERGMSRREAMNMVVTAVRDAQADGAI